MSATSKANMNLYDYPPLFTRQKNEQTWTAQKDTWQQIILESCRESKTWRLTSTSPIFNNESIDRTLEPAVATQILEFVASTGRGEWTSKAKEEMYIYWLTPSEIASIIRNWAEETGHKNTILTNYEVQEGEQIPELEGVDEDVLIKAINELQKRGDGTVLKEDGKVVGLKTR